MQLQRLSSRSDRPNLEAILEYQNDDVVDAFCSSLDIPRDKAQEIFRELMKFLWLSKPTAKSKSLCVIDDPILIIDEMWHTFVLFTREYQQFCQNYFGRFIHHKPTTVAERAASRELSDRQKAARFQTKRERYYEIYDLLGKETFVKWFHEFPEEFSRKTILELRKK